MKHKLATLTSIAFLTSCGGFDDLVVEDIPHDSNLPDLGDGPVVPRYNGDDPYMLEAQRRLPTVLDLHQKVIRRSCSGVNGVCHNQKEYPDMQSAEAMLGLIGAPCNAAPNDPLTVFDRCEQRGDTIQFPSRDSNEVEVGSLVVVKGDAIDFEDEGIVPGIDSPGLHVFLAEPISVETSDGNFYARAEWNRTIDVDGAQVDLAIASLETKWWKVDDGTHLIAEIPNYKDNDLEEVIDSSIVQGDINRNGVFGASVAAPLSLIAAGAPNQSYLVGRLRGTLNGVTVPGTRMPLANLPPTIVDMVALTCFIEGVQQGVRPGPSWSINYRDCSIVNNPESVAVTGNGAATWSGGVFPLLQANCGGCHNGDDPLGGLSLNDESTYERLQGPSNGNPLLNFITPGNPSSSYLWLKLTNDPAIVGNPMPWDSANGWRELSVDELNTVRSWIEAGALDD